MKTVVGIATFGRRNIKPTIDSLIHQVDLIYLYDNEQNTNLYDNGKFFGLTKIKEPCYYFPCDDDIIYPSNYIQTSKNYIDKYGCIISHHGRVLTKKDSQYYSGHKRISGFQKSNYSGILHVAGTGATGFRTDYFNPVDIINDSRHKMSDLLFSLEAAKKLKVIKTIPHQSGWLKHAPSNNQGSCYSTMRNNQQILIEIANEIIDIFEIQNVLVV